MTRRAIVETTADAYLELLAARGIDYFFGNGGTDFGPIIDAYARRQALEQPVPAPVLVPHEITAVAMAHGYTMVTGRPQVVMVHTVAGTANATGGLINARRGELPLLFTAGRTPISEQGLTGSRDTSIHWAQESFDQGAMVREWVKWDYELRSASDLETVVDRALAVSETAPQGPVYLILPREVLAAPRSEIEYADRSRQAPPVSVASPESIAAAAELLVDASRPIAVTRSIGRDPSAVESLVRLAELLALPVYDTGPTHMNFPADNPLHQSRPPHSQLGRADVILSLENDVPWMPASRRPGPDAKVISLGNDPLFARYPMRGFAADLALAGSPALTLTALADAVEALGVAPATLAKRRKRAEKLHVDAREHIVDAAASGREQRPLARDYVSSCIAALCDDDTIVVNELGFDPAQLALTRPGSYFGVPVSGVLGWALGAALGAKLAARDKTVICGVGDGAYMFGSPEAAHWVSRRMDLPVLWVVWNNARWNAVGNATRNIFPDGWAAKSESMPFTDLSPSLDFEMICQAAGGYGERVEDPPEVPAALQRALNAVQVEKRQALLNLIAG